MQEEPNSRRGQQIRTKRELAIQNRTDHLRAEWWVSPIPNLSLLTVPTKYLYNGTNSTTDSIEA